MKNRFDQQLWQQFITLAKPYWFSEEKWGARTLLGILLAMSFLVSGLNVLISFVGRNFSNALVDKNPEQFWQATTVYATVLVIATPITPLFGYIQDKLGLYWRQWMTNHFVDQYFHQRSYYDIQTTDKLDNPDQRISEDIRSFTMTSLRFLLVILTAIINLISFTGILWSISVPLTLILLGYSISGTIITVIFGQRLIGLNFNQLRKEADFRYGLVHIRDHAESIAFYQGEQQESVQVKKRFSEAIINFNKLIAWQRNLGFFTTGFNYFTFVLPSLFLAPIYFAGEIDFGAIGQAGLAFSQVYGALSIIVTQFEQISLFAAGTNRLGEFAAVVDHNNLERTDHKPQIDVIEEPQIALQHITLETPTHRTLVRDLSVQMQPSEGLLIVGQSGIGKSSLLRAIAGLWNNGTGRLVRPQLREMLFLPQHPYMILGTLREQLIYPNTDQSVTDEKLAAVLQQVNLADLPERVGGLDIELDWDRILSLGEQQRLAFARLLLTQPNYAILDEATSALDFQNEAALYQQLQQTKTTYVSVGHRLSLVQYHQWVLELTGDTQWRLIPAQDYQSAVSSLT